MQATDSPSEIIKIPSFDSQLKKIGKIPEDFKYIYDFLPQWHIEFCEELCKLWEFSRARQVYKESPDKLIQISEDEKPQIERCNIYQRFIRGARKNFVSKIEAAQNTDELKQEAIKNCRNDIHYWFTYFAYTFDPRMGELGLSSKVPFILFPKQKILIDSMRAWRKNRAGGGLIEKSREEGVSWLAMANCVYDWLYSDGYIALIASQNEEKVDVLGSRNPLFGKLRYLIYTLPVWMRPEGFETDRNQFDNSRFIKNPSNQNELKGEIGDSLGRSGRCSVLVIDESQDIEHPDKVNDAAESITNCRIDIGTPNGMNHFWKRRESGIPVCSIGWWEDPRKNPLWRDGMDGKRNLECAWRQYTEARINDPVILARNHDIDYNASTMGAFIPAEWVVAAIDFTTPRADDERVAGFDVAGGGLNEAVYVLRVGIVLQQPKISPFKTSTDAGWFAIRFGESDRVGLLNYDADGIGTSLNEIYRDSEVPIRFKTVGLRSGKAASEKMIEEEGITCRQKFMNKKSEVWWNLRERFRKTYEHVKKIRFHSLGEMISIPWDDKLIKQFSSPLMVSRAGRIGVESKESMKVRNIPSPDRADAAAYAFWDADDEAVANSFDYTAKSSHIEDKTIDHMRAVGTNYVSIFQAKDMNISALCCLWKSSIKSPKLIVYKEYVELNPLPETVVEEIEALANSELMKIKEWICNKDMIETTEKGSITQWQLYRKQGVSLRKNYFDDFKSSIVIINQMFDKNLLAIHEDCPVLQRQLINWKEVRGGEGNDMFGLAICLCQLVTRLKVKKELTEERIKEAEYGGYNKRDFEEEGVTIKPPEGKWHDL